MMTLFRKRTLALALGLTLMVAALTAFTYCKKDEPNPGGGLLLGLATLMNPSSCAANATSFFVTIPCGVAQ